jgi:hypothetical protein
MCCHTWKVRRWLVKVVGPLVLAAVAVGTVGALPAQANSCTVTQDRSIANSTQTSINFVNSSSLILRIYWLDYNGAQQPYSILQPGASHVQQTYAQTAWKVINDGDGVCHGFVIADTQPITYTIVDDPPPTPTSTTPTTTTPTTTSAFGPATLVGLELAATRIPDKAPLTIQVANDNGFEITGSVAGETTKKVQVAQRRRIKLKAVSLRVAAHSKQTVKLKLPKTLRRLLKLKGKLDLRLTASVKDPAGQTRSVKKRVTPKLKRSRSR